MENTLQSHHTDQHGILFICVQRTQHQKHSNNHMKIHTFSTLWSIFVPICILCVYFYLFSQIFQPQTQSSAVKVKGLEWNPLQMKYFCQHTLINIVTILCKHIWSHWSKLHVSAVSLIFTNVSIPSQQAGDKPHSWLDGSFWISWIPVAIAV